MASFKAPFILLTNNTNDMNGNSYRQVNSKESFEFHPLADLENVNQGSQLPPLYSLYLRFEQRI
jgi:hypothetical protein